MKHENDIAVVIQRIYEVFPISDVPVIKDPSRYSEVMDLQPLIENKTWADCVKDPILIYRLQYGFVLLAPDVQHYYLPALLCYVLKSPVSDDIRNEALQSLECFLYPPEWSIKSIAKFDRTSKLFSGEQLSLIASALIHIKETDPWLAEEIDIMLANYWLRYLE
jgi:hypothetical protein